MCGVSPWQQWRQEEAAVVLWQGELSNVQEYSCVALVCASSCTPCVLKTSAVLEHQHTCCSLLLPRTRTLFRPQEWSFLRGGLTTLDRDYGIFSGIQHSIGIHLVHHLFPQVRMCGM